MKDFNCPIFQNLSGGEICAANFITPADGASQVNNFLLKKSQADRQTDRQIFATV